MTEVIKSLEGTETLPEEVGIAKEAFEKLRLSQDNILRSYAAKEGLTADERAMINAIRTDMLTELNHAENDYEQRVGTAPIEPEFLPSIPPSYNNKSMVLTHPNGDPVYSRDRH